MTECVKMCVCALECVSWHNKLSRRTNENNSFQIGKNEIQIILLTTVAFRKNTSPADISITYK